ncbi:MAG: amidase family protein, partial [Gammaproteobacteria bacterium]|nr:amidase family protein [Gammaproteobacteria bacterium]
MTDNDILSLGVPDMVRSLASGELSSVAITSAYLDLARSLNPEINCYIRIEPDSALTCAEQADAARRRGNEAHPLCGMPTAITHILQRR